MSINAASIMTRQKITTRPDSTVAEVARLLTYHDISAVPVCDADGTLLGMISEGDLMRPFGREHDLHRAWWLGVLSAGDLLAQRLADYIRQDRRHVRDLMTHPAVTAGEMTTLGEIANLLLRHRIKRVPVLRDGQLVGIVSQADLVRELALWPDAFDHEEWQPSRAGSDRPLTDVAGSGGAVPSA
jgi:CBS domain-containing protein